MTSEPIEGEWIVVFYPTTASVRLHPTVEAAQQHLARHSWPLHIYRSPLDLKHRLDHFQLEKAWIKLYETAMWRFPRLAKGPISEADATPPDLPTDDFCKAFWDFMQRVGDRVTRLSARQTRSKDHYELKLDKMKALLEDPETFKKTYPKQARIIFEKLASQSSPYILESELQKIMAHLVAMGHLKTKQDSWLIFQFYRPQFIKDGFILRGDEDREEEDFDADE